ncbi:MAG: helix-turn-helix domain-containing protein [Alphaproteobacteria bacterium]|nr:helix-turn-helix domain-containing protein [Alphaproteobacteria bacterium]
MVKKNKPTWLGTLIKLMDQEGYSPRSLSLAAKLNETAVRDMIAGRARFPRYDTIRALARALNTTPAYLMGDEGIKEQIRQGGIKKISDLDLLTEIITRVQEVSKELGITPGPEQFARIVSALYHHVATSEGQDVTKKELTTRVHAIFDYESTNSGKTLVVNRR